MVSVISIHVTGASFGIHRPEGFQLQYISEGEDIFCDICSVTLVTLPVFLTECIGALMDWWITGVVECSQIPATPSVCVYSSSCNISEQCDSLTLLMWQCDSLTLLV